MASPARSLPPTSPLAAEPDCFTFDRSPEALVVAAAASPPSQQPGYSSQLSCPASLHSASPQPAAGNTASPSSANWAGVAAGSGPLYYTHPSAASPRTRIKTIAGGGSCGRVAAAGSCGSSRESSVETLRPASSGSPAHTLRSPFFSVGQLPTNHFSISDYQVW